MTAQEFLFDTVHHYNSGNRCVTDSMCAYSPITVGKENSEGCAIGRYLDPELALQIDKEVSGKDSGIRNIFGKYPLPEWMTTLGVDFLMQIQRLHDYGNYWYSEGLSQQGKRYVQHMCKNWNLDYEQLKLN